MTQPVRCCVCHGLPDEDSGGFTRWPGSSREYCKMDWEKVGQFRAVEDMADRRPGMEAA